MKKFLLLSILFLLFLTVGLCVWGLPFPFLGEPDPYCVMNVGPSVSWGASGTYTYYVGENTITEPAHRDPIPVSVSGNARGLGWVYITISSVTVDGQNTLGKREAGIAPRDDIGFSGYTVSPLGNLPIFDAVNSDDFSFSINGANWRKAPKTYEWSVNAEVVLTGIDWQGDDWVADPETRTSYNPEGSGTWIVESTNVCSICKQTGLSSPTAHYVNPCPNAGCQEGGWYWNCYGVPSSHALLATCSSCNATNVYACSGHPDDCPSSSSSSSDLTPNCPDCTSHCSSPCSCTNSGTCNGTVTDETPNCSDCTSHCSSPCGCTNSGTCNGSVVDDTNDDDDSSSDDDDSSDDDSSGGSNTIGCDECGESYPADHPNVEYLNNLHRERTCRFSGCGNSWHACSIVGWSPLCNNPYRKSKGWKCGE